MNGRVLTRLRGRRPGRLRRALILAVGLLSAAFSSEAAPTVGIQLVANGIPYLVDIQRADSSGRLFLVSQDGVIRILQGGSVLGTPFLDISSSVNFAGEQGLLGLAFHPQYAANGRFFVHYIDTSGNTSVIARYTVSSDPNVAEPSSRVEILAAPQPASNHDGGAMAFGPDGFLYIARGDGGTGGALAQQLDSLSGKILRIDVDSSSPYAIPATNPFTDTAGARGEIWALGLRNPWKISFDRLTGEMFIADVGQNTYEEVSYQPAADGGGRNYGWRIMEGRHCFDPPSGCSTSNLVQPIAEYTHDFGCSITGGYRYRGSQLAGFQGTYFFSDLCGGRIFGAARQPDGTWTTTVFAMPGLTVTTFGEDADGELYLSHYAAGGAIYRLVPASATRLTVSKIGSGTVTTSPQYLNCGDICASDVGTGTTLSLVATPAGGATFLGWSGDADCADGSITLSADRSCIARFRGPFTDASLNAGVSVIRLVHVTELRQRIDDLRVAAGLAAFAWTDDPLPITTHVRAAHVGELRTALQQAYAARGRSWTPVTDSGSLDGLTVKAAHIVELRSAVVDLESAPPQR